STQAAVDTMIRLAREHDLHVEDVARIEARISARRLEHTNRPTPRSALDAKLSAQYVLARALVNREVTLAHFEGNSYRNMEITGAMELVHLDPLDVRTLAQEGDFFADVSVTLSSGRRIVGSIDRPAGHHAGVLLDSRALKAKYESCVRHHLT